MRKFLLCLTMASIAIGSVAVPAQAGPKQKVFNSLPAQLPGNVASVGFEATQTDAFGDQIRLAPGKRKLKKVRIVMSSWACEMGSWTAGCETTQGATFNEAITLTLYRANTRKPEPPRCGDREPEENVRDPIPAFGRPCGLRREPDRMVFVQGRCLLQREGIQDRLRILRPQTPR